MLSNDFSPRSFRVELGFDREADRILGTRPESHLYPLQNALVDITGGDGPGQAKPAWYTKLSPKDTVYIRLLDITDLVHGTCDAGHQPSPPSPSTLIIETTHPRDQGQRVKVLEQEAHWRPKYARCVSSPVFSTGNQQFSGFDLYPNPADSLPGVIRDLPAGEPFLTAELSMLIQIDGVTHKKFVFDPEMIIGPQSGGGPG